MAWTIISGGTYNIVDIDAETCGDNCSIDIKGMLSTPMSAITTLDEFRLVFSNELIDVKHWKTQTTYPTLRLVYDRYLNSTNYCDTTSSKFNYLEMIKFSELVGTYWVDLIEQVIPSTTIWGSTYVYGNTIFDQQKFTYKKYSLFNCNLPNFGGDVVSPSSGWTDNVQVEWEILPDDIRYDSSGTTTGTTGSTNTIPSQFSNIIYQRRTPKGLSIIPAPATCNGVGIVQINCGSEFIGRIVDYSETNIDSGIMNISECSIAVDITNITSTGSGTYSADASVGGDVTGPISYLWSDGQTTQTAIGLTAGTYSVIVTDDGVGSCSANANITIS